MTPELTNDGSPGGQPTQSQTSPAPIVLAITKAVALRKSKRRALRYLALRYLSSWQADKLRFASEKDVPLTMPFTGNDCLGKILLRPRLSGR